MLPRYPAGARIGAYVVERTLTGATAAPLYLGRQSPGGSGARQATLKPAPAVGPLVDQLRREAALLATIAHPHVLQPIPPDDRGDAGEPATWVAPAAPQQPLSPWYLALDPVCGGSLADLIGARGALPWATAAEIGRQLAQALGYLHGRQIIHLHLSLDNVFLRAPLARWGRLRPDLALLGFGQAWSPGSPIAPQPPPSHPAIAPERLAGAPPHPLQDLYALGALLYTLLTGEQPTATPARCAGALRRAGVPAALAELIEVALAPEPQQRIASARQLRWGLDQALLAGGPRHALLDRRMPAPPPAPPAAAGDSSTMARQLEQLYTRAMALDGPTDRDQDDPCGRGARRPGSVAEGPQDGRHADVWPGQRADLPEQIGPYRVLRHLGEGGTSRVLLGRDEQHLGRLVVLKLLRADDATTAAQFRQEGLLRFQHRHIVQVYAAGVSGEQAWIAQEYLPGCSLRRLVRLAPLDLDLALALAGQLLEALGQVHAQGVIHCDVKPENLLLVPGIGLKLIDFGSARLKRGQPAQRQAVSGTVHYMTGELAAGQAVDPTTDLYAAATVLYELLTGYLPFPISMPQAIARRQQWMLPTPPRQMNPRITWRVEAAILRALAGDPRQRPATASKLSAALGCRPDPDRPRLRPFEEWTTV